MFRKFTQWFGTPPPHSAPADHRCNYEGCTEVDVYRAPRSRKQLNRHDNNWFCLAHVREYNNSWNYYTNMSEIEIIRERQSDIIWDRSSWPANSRSKNQAYKYKFDDPFGFFEFGTENTPIEITSHPDQDALDLLNLSFPFTREQLQKNYRHLVKKYHPDLNQASLNAQEMIRKINQAYAQLQKTVTQESYAF